MSSSVTGSRVRVLHVIQNLNYGGMERLLADIVQRLDETVFESHVLCLEYLGRYADEVEGDAELHLVQPRRTISMLHPGRMISFMTELKPHVVHSHSGVWFKASLAARRARVPRVIHTDHGRRVPDPWPRRMIDRAASGRTDVVVAVSEALRRQLLTTVVRPGVRVEVVRNGVDTELHRPMDDSGELRRELDLPASVKIIGSIGRLMPIKGYDVMVRAFAVLVGELDPVTTPVLVIAGNGAERAKLEAMARELGVAEGIRFLGWRDDIRALHAAFDLFSLSSHSEGTSVSLLEAMSAGICPVVTRVGGNEAVLGPDLEHRLVSADSPRQLAEAWLRALQDDAARAADAAAARSRVEAEFSLSGMVGRYAELYSRQEAPARGPVDGLRP